MANTAQARKRAIQNVKLNAHNSSLRSRMRTAVKQLKKSLSSGDLSSVNESYIKAQKILDSSANKKLIHRNTAARIKSRLITAIKSAKNASANA